jgi:hypothetical protein
LLFVHYDVAAWACSDPLGQLDTLDYLAVGLTVSAEHQSRNDGSMTTNQTYTYFSHRPRWLVDDEAAGITQQG